MPDGILIEFGFNFQPRSYGRAGDQINHYFMIEQNQGL